MKINRRLLRLKAKEHYRFRFVWWLRQLLPLTYWVTYQSFVIPKDGVSGVKTNLAIFKCWLWRVYRVIDVQVITEEK